MRHLVFLTFGAAAVLLGLSGCGLSIYQDWQAGRGQAMIGGGAIAGQDYVNGLLPSSESRQYFSKIPVSGRQASETVTRSDEHPGESGVRYVKNGGILIPPGVTISFTNQGYCMDPHLPAPVANEEYQLVPVARLIPEELQGTYRKLVQKASAGDSAVLSNMQHLVWALRTAGTEAAYANNLTAQQRTILDRCSDYSGQFESFHANAQSNSRRWKELLGLADSYLNIQIGGVTYKASDLLDPEVGKKKISEHLNQLIAQGKVLPVEQSGFNFGELQSGIYTDVRGAGVLAYKARIANSTGREFVFYPADYIGQVGSGVQEQGLSFFALANTVQRQRVTTIPPDQVEVVSRGVYSSNPKSTLDFLSEKLGLATSEREALENLGLDGLSSIYQESVTAAVINGYALDGGSGKYLNLLKDKEQALKSGKVVHGKYGTPLDYNFGLFVGDFSTSIATGQWEAAAAATERYVLDATLGTFKTCYNAAFLAGAWFYDLTH